MSLFVVAIPLSTVIGAPLSNWILSLSGIGGLHGWQWLFLLEGLFAVLLGLLAPRLLPDGPEKVVWLTREEKWSLLRALDDDRQFVSVRTISSRSLLRNVTVLSFASQYFALMVGLYALGFWVPRILKTRGVSSADLGWLTAVPFAAGAVLMLLSSFHSDRSGERKWHVVASFLCAAMGIAIAAPGRSWVLALGGLAMAASGVFSAMPVFWTALTQSVDADLAPFAVAGQLGWQYRRPRRSAGHRQHPATHGVVHGRFIVYERFPAVWRLHSFAHTYAPQSTFVTTMNRGETASETTSVENMMRDLKADARQLFFQALGGVDVRKAVTRHFRLEGLKVIAAGKMFDLTAQRRITVIAIGKAATPMYEASMQSLRIAGWPEGDVRSLVVSPQRPQSQYGALLFFPGAHPTPNETSRRAATAILEELRSAASENFVPFLMSGGSSAMVELPLDPTISNADVAQFHRVLVGSGLSIMEINCLRKHLSAVKGGRLAEAAAQAAQCTLIVSDVPENVLDAVGSGPSLPDSTSLQECRDIYRRLRATHRLPAKVEHMFESGLASETPKRAYLVFARAAWTCILSSDDLAGLRRRQHQLWAGMRRSTTVVMSGIRKTRPAIS